MAGILGDVWKLRRGLVPTEEAIRFQVSSAFGKELEQAFLDAYVAYGKYTGGPGVVTDTFIYARAVYMGTYCRKSLFPRMKAIILKHTGIEITKFHSDQDKKMPIPNGFFAVDITFGDAASAVEVRSDYTGTESPWRAHTADKKKALEEFRHMGDSLSIDGTLGQRTYGKDKTPIAAEMYFDPTTAFCLGDYLIKSDSDGRNLTAGELTGIILHEVGHLVSQLEWCKDVYYAYKDKERTLAYLKDQLTVDDLQMVFSDAAVRLNKEKAIPAEDKKTYTKMAECLEAAQQHTEEQKDTNVMFKGLEVVGQFLLACFFAYYYLVLSIVLEKFLGGIFSELYFNIQTSGTAGVKQGDVISTQKNLRIIEARADEYVSRQGYSAELASGLHTLITSFRVVGSAGMSADPAIQRNRWCIGVVRCLGVIGTLVGQDTRSNYTYDDLDIRIKKIGENLIPALKQAQGLPATLLDSYIGDYERVRQVYTKQKNAHLTRFVDVCGRVLKKVVIPTQMYRAIAEGGLRDEYGVLMQHLDTLSNNPLYYYAAKFKQLSR